MNQPRLFVILAFFTSVFFICPAFALSPVDNSALSPIDKEAAIEADFDTLIDQARVAFGEGDYEAALEYLVIANRLEDEPRLFLNIARSYEELEQCEKALVYYEAFLKSDDDEQALIDRARSAIESGAPDCPAYHENLGGRLLLESDPQLAAVYVNDQLIGTTPTETVALEPGLVEVRFERVGYELHTEEFEIVSDQEMELRVTLVEEGEEDPVVEEPTSGDRAGKGGGADVVGVGAFKPNPIALGLGGAGLIGLGVGAYLDLVELPRIDAERQEADDATELTRRRQSVALGAVGAYITGGVLLAGGLAWLGYDYWSHTQDDEPMSWQVAPSIGPHGASMTFFRRF